MALDRQDGSSRRGGARPKRTRAQGASADARARRRSGNSSTRRRRRSTAQGDQSLRKVNAARGRKYQTKAEWQRQRMIRAGLGVAALVLCLVLVFMAIRGVAGCVSRVFAPKESEKTAQQQEQEAKAAEPVQIDLIMIGDILQHSGVYQSGFIDDNTRNYDHVFAHIGSEIEGADIKVVNQETVLGGDSFEFSGYPTFNGPQEMGDAEAKAGFNVILRATNHALDVGYEGLSSEISFWKTQHPEVAVIGAADPDDPSTSVDDLYVFEKDGFKVALLNYTYDLNGFEDPKGAVSILDEDHVRSTVSAADAVADMVVVFPHWGEEYELQPVESQREMAQVFMEAGADVIIGGHPHVIEPVEVLTAPDGRKVPCFWSVGNFISTQIDNENLVGGVAKVSMTKDNEGNCQVIGCSFVPTITHKGTGSNMTTYLLRDYTDSLAETNYLEANGTDNTSLTVDWANDFCREVLGSSFDTATEQIVFGPEQFEPQQGATGASGEAAAAQSEGRGGGAQEDEGDEQELAEAA